MVKGCIKSVRIPPTKAVLWRNNIPELLICEETLYLLLWIFEYIFLMKKYNHRDSPYSKNFYSRSMMEVVDKEPTHCRKYSDQLQLESPIISRKDWMIFSRPSEFNEENAAFVVLIIALVNLQSERVRAQFKQKENFKFPYESQPEESAEHMQQTTQISLFSRCFSKRWYVFTWVICFQSSNVSKTAYFSQFTGFRSC